MAALQWGVTIPAMALWCAAGSMLGLWRPGAAAVFALLVASLLPWRTLVGEEPPRPLGATLASWRTAAVLLALVGMRVLLWRPALPDSHPGRLLWLAVGLLAVRVFTDVADARRTRLG